MELWIILILAIAIPLSLLLSSLFLFLRCRRHRHRQPPPPLHPPPPPPQFISDHQTQLPKNPSKLRLSKNSLRFHHLPQSHHHQQHVHQETSFNWDGHPNLISVAAKNGWPGFVFADRASIPRSTSSPLWGLCAACDGGLAQEFAGEGISSSPSEALQTVRINPSGTNNNEPVSVRMNLPLPGPQLNRASFPQEAYFEITILYIKAMDRASRASKRAKDGPKSDGEDDRLKLIEEGAQGLSDVVDDGVIEGKRFKSPSASAERKHRNSVVSLGFMAGGSPVTNTTPGTYRGSVGFHSDGSVYLDGLMLVTESERGGWAGANRVIGCGFNPVKKKVYFTLDSELKHVIRCTSDIYKNPLYPILSSNSDTMVLVNLGQSAFKYAPANAQRSPNPCFARVSPYRYEDSGELFSLARIGSEWTDGDKRSKNSCRSSGNWDDASVALDIDGESDLFEISLHN